MKTIVPKSKNKPVRNVLKRAIKFHETSSYCQMKNEILKNCERIKNQMIKCTKSEYLPKFEGNLYILIN